MCPIMPERLASQPHNRQVTEMVGSGPFRFVAAERLAGARVVYEAFEGYVPRPAGGPVGLTTGPKVAQVKRVEWHVMPDAATAVAALRQGEVDWIEQTSADLLPVLRRDAGIATAVKDPEGSIGFIRFNHLQPPFDNPAIRRAFLAGVDQADYMTATMGTDRSLWQDKVGFFTPGSTVANDAGMDALTAPRSLDRVKRALEEAGYKGEKVVFIVPTDLPALNAMSEIAADMFRRTGVNLDYQALDWGTVLPRLSNRQTPDRGGWSVWCNYLPGVVAVNPTAHSWVRGMGLRGPVGWPESARMEALRDTFLETSDEAEQQRLAREMQLQAFQDIPYIPTGFYYQPTAFRSNIRNIVEAFPVFWGVEKG